MEEYMLILRIHPDIPRGRDIGGSICWISFRGSKVVKERERESKSFRILFVPGRFDLGYFFKLIGNNVYIYPLPF